MPVRGNSKCKDHGGLVSSMFREQQSMPVAGMKQVRGKVERILERELAPDHVALARPL